jgi:hypothetical protein
MRFAYFKPKGMLYCWIAISFCVSLFLFAASVNAQTAGTASIQGVVTDSTGAVIQNATVTATNIATQVKHSTVTSSSGLYSFPNIAIGTYTLEATATGFERYRQSNIVLEVGSSIAINPALKIGGANQTVEVQSTGLALQTEDSSLKQTIGASTVVEMPLGSLGRQMTSLITLTGGAVNANENNDESGSKTFYSSAVISIGGGQGNATDYRLDGADHNDYMTNVNLPFPFPDAVAEFAVESAALGAQSGLHPGGLVNVVTKSGTNQWHGDAFEFIRNNYLDAINFFSASPDQLHMDQFGGTFGGKIIPNKLFGFVGYQRYVSKQIQSSSSAYVPTADNLAGNFSITDPIAKTQLLDPVTGIALVNNNYTGTTGVAWNPNAQALALEAYLPSAAHCSAANYCVSADTAAGGSGLVKYAIPQQLTENLFVTRIDATINQKHSLYGRYLLDGYNNAAFFSPTNALVTSSPGNLERVQALTIAETYVITNNLVNTAHLTADRRRNNRGPAAQGLASSTIGVTLNDLANEGMQLTVSGGTGNWGIYCGTCSAAHFNVNTLSFTDDINWTHGKHQIAFGGEWVQTELNVANIYEGNGKFTFDGTFAGEGPHQSLNNKIREGNLDFLTGSMNGFEQSKAQQNALREPIPSLYVQDTYHATNRIVVNAGVRWDPEFVATDYFNRGSVFNMTQFMAATPTPSVVYPNAPYGTYFYGDPGVPKAFTQNSPWQFSPRVGITFDPDGKGKTVLRAGAAMVYDEPNLFTGQRVQQNPPFAETIKNTATTASGPMSFSAPWSVGSSAGPQPFPQPIVPPSTAPFFKGTQYIVLPTKFQSPYTLQYTASVQHQFGNGWQAQLSYVGNSTVHGPYGLPMSPSVYTAGADPHIGGAADTTGNAAARYYLTEQNPAARGGPMYSGGGTGSMYIMSGAGASYHGVIASIEHRLSSNFVFMANYTYSHCIDISDNAADVSTITIQNPANIKGDKGSCGFDFRHVFNISLVASTHFSATGWKNQVLNHWQISPLVHATDGNPFTVTLGVDNSLTAVGNDRPNLTGANVYTHNKITQPVSGVYTSYVNKYAFGSAPLGAFGSSGRFAYRGPKFLETDCALNRSFAVYRAFALNLRLEAFNVLNHPNFAAPGSSTGASGYLGTSTAMTSGTFGTITATMANGGAARTFQGAIKITF